MFAYETEMVKPATKWLESLGLTVKTEFVTPWGVCDLVGARMDGDRVSKRLGLRQTRPIASPTRAAILLRIPDVESPRPITLGKLVRDCSPAIPEDVVVQETQRLIADRYVVQLSRQRLQKLNGWTPLQERLVALELKLSRVDEAMSQAVDNLSFADESYVGLPTQIAKRVLARKTRWEQHLGRGIGLVGVGGRSCSVMVPASMTTVRPDTALQFYCVEKFWRTYPKGS